MIRRRWKVDLRRSQTAHIEVAAESWQDARAAALRAAVPDEKWQPADDTTVVPFGINLAEDQNGLDGSDDEEPAC